MSTSLPAARLESYMSDLSSLEHAFYTGDYTSVHEFDLDKLEAAEITRGRNLAVRALIASGQAREAQQQATGDVALKLYADYSLGDASAVESAKKLPESDQDKHLHALVLAGAKEYSAALELLETAGQSLDCAMLAVHIHLALGDLARAGRVVDEMRAWSNDHIVFNLCEAWVSLRQNGQDAQKAYYIFEEHNAYRPTARSHTGEAVAQLELHRLPEAAESVRRALELDQTEDALATAVAVSSVQGVEPAQLPKLQQLQHSEIVADLKQKSDLFDQAAAKYVK